MKYKTLFRLLLKLLGVWLVAEAMPELVISVIWVVQQLYQWQTAGSGNPLPSAYIYNQLINALVRVAVGGYLFFGGRWIVDMVIPSNRPYCPECGYELTGNMSPKCPECGTATQKLESSSN